MSETHASLILRNTDNRDNLNTIANFHVCLYNELRQYNSSAALKQFMQSENFDSICAEEINSLKGISGSIGVKETRAIYAKFFEFNKDIYN